MPSEIRDTRSIRLSRRFTISRDPSNPTAATLPTSILSDKLVVHLQPRRMVPAAQPRFCPTRSTTLAQRHLERSKGTQELAGAVD